MTVTFKTTGNRQADLQNYMNTYGKSKTEAINDLNSIRATETSSSSSNSSNNSTTIDDDALAKQLGYSSREEAEAALGKPGEKTPQEIKSILGLTDEDMLNIFGDYQGTDSSSDDTTTDDVDSFTKTQDDKYKAVANAVGLDELTVSAIMKAAAEGYDVYDLGIPKSAVKTVMSYLGLI